MYITNLRGLFRVSLTDVTRWLEGSDVQFVRAKGRLVQHIELYDVGRGASRGAVSVVRQVSRLSPEDARLTLLTYLRSPGGARRN